MAGITHFGVDLENVISELAGLAQLCNINLRAPGVIDAIIRGDPSIRNENPIAFDKLKGLLSLAITMVDRAIENEGVNSTGDVLDRIFAEIEERRTRLSDNS